MTAAFLWARAMDWLMSMADFAFGLMLGCALAIFLLAMFHVKHSEKEDQDPRS